MSRQLRYHILSSFNQVDSVNRNQPNRRQLPELYHFLAVQLLQAKLPHLIRQMLPQHPRLQLVLPLLLPLLRGVHVAGGEPMHQRLRRPL